VRPGGQHFLTHAPRSAARSTRCQNTTCSAQTLGERWCGHDSSPRVHLVTFRPLQLSSVRCGISGCPTFMCSGVYRPYRMLQYAWSLAREGVTTSPRSWATTLVLPVRQRVEFKLAVLVYKAPNNLASPYLSDDCQLVATTGRCQLRSSDNFSCTMTCSSSRLGDRAFAAAGPRQCPSTWFIIGHLLPQTENLLNCSRKQRLSRGSGSMLK